MHLLLSVESGGNRTGVAWIDWGMGVVMVEGKDTGETLK